MNISTMALLNFSEAENSFDYFERRKWVTQYLWFSIAVSILYIVLVFVGPKLMLKRAPFSASLGLVAWNTGLSCFSLISLLHLTPEFIGTLKDSGFRDSYCLRGSYYIGASGYWAWLFHASKVVELGDTVFLILRKRPILFLHWYHHAATLVVSWYCYTHGSPTVRWGVFMNLCVHWVMYGYFAVSVAIAKLPRCIAMTITSLQLVQFLIGSAITIDVFLRTLFASSDHPEPCGLHLKVSLAQLMLYASFMVLFAQFFYRSYCKKKTL